MTDADDDLLWQGDRFEFRVMTRHDGERPGRDWYDGLDRQGKALFDVAAKIIETNFVSGRPGPRAELIEQSSEGLWEMKVTKPGSSPPHHRALFLRRGNTFWITHGFVKKKNKLPPAELSRGDSIAREWKQSGGEDR